MKVFSVITNIPSPYRIHLFEVLNAQLQARGWTIEVNFMSRGEKGRPDSWLNPAASFKTRYWRDYGFRGVHFNPGLIWHAIIHRPQVLLCGSQFHTLTGIFVSLFARAEKKVAWTEGNTKTTGEMGGLRGTLKRLTFRQYDCFAVPGIEGKRYVSAVFSVRQAPPCFLLPNLVDERKFMPRMEWPTHEIAQIRKKYLTEGQQKLCIIPARLEWYKGLGEMMELLSADMLADWQLLVIGGGALRHDLISIAERQCVSRHITFVSQVDYAQMPLYYAASDLFLLPSLMDRNPLSVVEAVHSGLPIAESDKCGNVEEAVKGNGWVLAVSDREAFRAQLKRVFATPLEELRRMGAVSHNQIASFWQSNESVSRFLDDLEILEDVV